MQSDVRRDETPAMGVFFSPPEATKPDSFASTQSPLRPSHVREQRLETTDRLPFINSVLQPLSPPISPATKHIQELGSVALADDDDTHDPPLFPGRLHSDASQPLFRSYVTNENQSAVSSAIDQHISTLDTAASRFSRPTREEYQVVAGIVSKVVDRYNADPRAYIRKELEHLRAYPPRWQSQNPVSGIKRKADLDTRATKRARPALKASVEKLPPVKRSIRASPRDLPVDSFDAVQPAPKHRRKVSKTAATPREDMDYRKIPDYSPPVDLMLPGKTLKIDWKGQPLDLSDDPDRALLSEHEVTLASVLRLTGAQYLFAKRRIFETYVDLARVGKDLNKTSAQAVCKIDVNKASKLWIAFEKVGWFDRQHFRRYLD